MKMSPIEIKNQKENDYGSPEKQRTWPLVPQGHPVEPKGGHSLVKTKSFRVSAPTESRPVPALGKG